jgi:peptidoglycan/LPS O-acetylase OafA/YrhL
MSLRTRELVNLLGVGLLTAAGFAAVYIARQEELSTTSLSYAGFFLALFLGAHVVARVALPYADPYLLPLAGVLSAIGLTMIYRIEPDRAFRQGLWIVVGVGALAALVLVVRDHRRLDGVK